MFDALGRGIYKHRRLVGIGAAMFFVIAIALGGSVSKHLAPYGADDPSTESVRADDLTQSKGFRDTSVVVLVSGSSVSSPQMKSKVTGIANSIAHRHDVAS